MDVAVLDELPLLRLGAIVALGGGHELGSVEELDAWLARRGSPAVLLLTLAEDDDAGWALLASLHAQAALHPVVLLSPFSISLAAAALRVGAVHVAPRDADPDTLRRIVAEVERGVVTLSIDLLRVATTVPRHGTTSISLTDDELTWLRSLGQGVTVATLARAAGLSERVMYRRLGLLYRRLGVSGRTQALMLARDVGWL